MGNLDCPRRLDFPRRGTFPLDKSHLREYNQTERRKQARDSLVGQAIEIVPRREPAMKRTIKIIGHEYRVTKRHFKKENNYTLFGMTDYLKHEIWLNRKNCREQDSATLLHEIVHVVSTLTGSNLTERQVVAISNGIFAAMKDNKRLFLQDFHGKT